MRISLTAILFCLGLCLRGQLFDNPANIEIARRGVNFIYNMQADSAQVYIKALERKLPNHPASTMMSAMNILWTNIPLVTVDSVFKEFNHELRETIRRAERLDGGREEHPEAIFFEMAARGLLAEYYADAGQYMKALNEAGQAYDLIKKGFDLSEEIPEFLLTTGVYNYFREKYPEKYPVYKPLMWFFRGGDVELGIQQIKQATQKAMLTKVEAYVYLAYIYLRYEYEPKKAQSYLKELAKSYPNNLYVKAKYLESLTTDEDFKYAPAQMIRTLEKSERTYYQMVGSAFRGFYFEKITKENNEAEKHYKQSLALGSKISMHSAYYECLSHLGLARIHYSRNDHRKAEYHIEEVLASTHSEEFESEAKALRSKLGE